MLGEHSEKCFDAAILIELLHTATLVHDDVVDDANERRGAFSINALVEKQNSSSCWGFYAFKNLAFIFGEKQC